jgi:anti-anti-sigma factor
MSNFTIVTRTAASNPAVSVVDVAGSFDINTVVEFEVVLEDFFKKKYYKIILNFEKLTYVSSAGVGLLVGNFKEIRKNGGDIKIAGLSLDVYKVFDILELTKVFRIFKTEQEAVSDF